MPERQIGRPERELTADEYVQRRVANGARVVRLRAGWLVSCPGHDDEQPSLRVSTGRTQPVVLHCFVGCATEDVLACDQLTLADICASGSATHAGRRREVPSIEQLAYLRISSNTCLSHVMQSCVRFARATTQLTIGIDPTGSRRAVEEEQFSVGDLMVRMPTRAGKNMRAVLRDFVELANERLAGGRRCEPIAYGSIFASQRLGIRRSEITKALAALERHGVIERVRRLPLLGVEDCGAWTWRLVVVPAIEPAGPIAVEGTVSVAQTFSDGTLRNTYGVAGVQ